MARKFVRSAATAVALFVASVVAVATTAGLASADDGVGYQVAFTDIGIYPRAEPSMDSAHASEVLTDGAWVSIACELEGAPTSNGYQTSTVWERLTDGTYLPNAFIDTSVDGYTPGIPTCDALDSAQTTTEEKSDQSTTESPIVYEGTPIPNSGSVAYALYDHYLWEGGSPVVIDFSYFSDNTAFMDWAEQLPVDGYDSYYANGTTDLYWALGAFSVTRTSENCYAIKDHYDFTPDKFANAPFVVFWAYQISGAREFDVRSSGCV